MPSCFYGPDDQTGIFDECPKGWADHPSKVKRGDPSNAGEDLSDQHNVPTASAEALVKAAKPRRKATRRDPR